MGQEHWRSSKCSATWECPTLLVFVFGIGIPCIFAARWCSTNSGGRRVGGAHSASVLVARTSTSMHVSKGEIEGLKLEATEPNSSRTPVFLCWQRWGWKNGEPQLQRANGGVGIKKIEQDEAEGTRRSFLEWGMVRWTNRKIGKIKDCTQAIAVWNQ